MEQLIVLPPVKDRVTNYKDIPNNQLKQMANPLPGGSAACVSRTAS